MFDYAWTGGSLSPAPGVPGVEFNYGIPTLGEWAGFHQFLLHSSQPTPILSYNVSLEDNHFKVSQ